MKIFILNPNFNLEKKSLMNVRARQPLSLALIASILRQDGHQVKFLDANVLNLSLAKIVTEINNWPPECLILTSSPIDRWECPNSHIDNIFKIINSVKVKYKVLTGSHGTTMPDWVFKKCQVDFIVRGEPELVVRNLIRALSEKGDLSQVNGISYQSNKPERFDKIINNPSTKRIIDLDKLPFPAYDLLPMDKYQCPGFDQPFSIMVTSRGCPYSCTFCLKAMLPGRYIARSPKNVIQEIEYLIKNFQVKSIYFQDWEFLIDFKRVEQICRLILQKKILLNWGCNARASDVAKNKELIKLMKQACCIKINMGLESASDKILDNINKKVSPADLQRAIDILKSHHIEGGYYVLLNCPGEDKETIKETVDFIIKNNLKVKNFNPVIPYPGTELFEELKKEYPDKKFNWENIEDYAGRVRVKMSPKKALFYLRHYKYQKQYGRLYFLKPKFWQSFLKKKL